MENIFERLLAALDDGERAVLVTVVKTEGSVPRHAGARMLCLNDGSFRGTVGGGRIEYLAQKKAAEYFDAAEPEIISYSLGGGGAEDTGMVCGGAVWLEFRPADESLRPLALENAGEGRVLVYGGGHVAAALCPALTAAGFRCDIFDDRPALAVAGRFPAAESVTLLDFDAAEVSAGARDYVVIMTHGHRSDYALLKKALLTPAGYVGVMSSRKKAERLREWLRRDGYSEPDIARLHSPIGLPIGAETPEEIAVSVAAQLIRARRMPL